MMRIHYSDQPLPTSQVASIFLAGPSPRRDNVHDWRNDAIAYLKSIGFEGDVFVPIPRHRFEKDGSFMNAHAWSYDKQIEWECAAREMADSIVFWIPRVIDQLENDLGMPAFTTNVEFGEDMHSGKVWYGHPSYAVKCTYLDERWKMKGNIVYASLDVMLDDVVQWLDVGALRQGGEVGVPLHVWRTDSFQSWIRNLRESGNRLDGSRCVASVHVGQDSSFLFAYALHVKVWLEQEQRWKSNEVVFARPDIAGVVPLYRGSDGSTFVVLVKEFRSTVNNRLGYVVEIPSGSSATKVDPLVNACNELHEETGLRLESTSRVSRVSTRQLAATFSTHRADLYAVNLKHEEFVWLCEQADKQVVLGNQEDGERTTLFVVPLEEMHRYEVDYSTIGMVYEAVRSMYGSV